MVVVAAAHDRPLAVLRHDEGQRRGVDLARMDRDSVLRAHVLKHPPEPVIGDGRDQVGHDAELGAAERRRDRVAAERNRVVGSDMFFVAGRHVVGDKGDVDIGLSDEKGLHSRSVVAIGWSRRRPTLAPDIAGVSLKLFASLPLYPPKIADRPDKYPLTPPHQGIVSMITALDHVVLLLENIKEGASAYQSLFGQSPSWRSRSDGAETVLFTLDNMTLELMAPAGHTPAADRVRDAIKTSGEGLASICFGVDDIAKMHRRLDRLALKPEAIAEVESRDADSGATLSWKRTRAATDLTRGVRMFFLELAGERPRSAVVSAAPILGLDHVVVSTGDPERAAALYGARLGLDMALDRSHPDWGRLMFFRCGDLIVEVVHRPVTGGDVASDKLWGLSWRVADIDATHARLKQAGFDVSEVRTGRKPGTRVMSVRSGTCGVATLLIERTGRG